MFRQIDFSLKVLLSFGKVQASITRSYHHVRPVIKYNLTKPQVDITKYDPQGSFSDPVIKHIQARDFENSTSERSMNVMSLYGGDSKGVVPLNDFVFGANPRLDIMHRNVVWYRASIRSGTADVKRRSEVRGGGRKPWQQKGTGRARQGSIRAPHWRKGGSAKGPKPRDYAYDLPYKVRRMGLRTALSSRYTQGDLTIVEDFDDIPEHPQDLSLLLEERGLHNSLLVDGFKNRELISLTSEMEKVDVSTSLYLHVYGILVRNKLVLSLSALRILEEKLCEDNRIVTDPNYELYHQDMLLDKSLLYHEYNPKNNDIRGRPIPKIPKKSTRHKLPMSRRDLKR